MAQLRLGLGLKVFSLLSASLLLSGCYKIEIKETLNLDGTSDIAIKMDISGMMDAMTGMASGMAESFSSLEGLAQETAAPTEENFYESCNDPKLLAKYGATNLDEPQNLVRDLNIEKVTHCEPSDEEGFINVITQHTNQSNEEMLFDEVVSRKAETCNDPAILAFYQLGSFDIPITETYLLKEQIETSCSEDEIEIVFNTVTKLGEDGDPMPLTQIFNKKPTTLAAETSTESSSSMDPEVDQDTEESGDEVMQEMNFCEEAEQDPTQMPFFFDKCEDIAPGIGAFHFSKYDTTGFTINSNDTVTYNLEPSTTPVQSDFDSGLQNNADDSMPLDMDPASMGFVMEYVLVSPWPILDHSHGTLDNQYTLRIDLLKDQTDDQLGLSVTLDTDGATLDMLAPHIQKQIDKLIDSLQEKLEASDSPVERQVEYIFHLSNKIQRLAALRPEQQVPLGYLQTKLVALAEKMQRAPLENLEGDLLSELEALSEDAWNEADESFDDASLPEEDSLEDATGETIPDEELSPGTETTEASEANSTAPEGDLSDEEESFDDETEEEVLDEANDEEFLD